MKKQYSNPETEIALVLSGMMMVDTTSTNGPGYNSTNSGSGTPAAPGRGGFLGPSY